MRLRRPKAFGEAGLDVVHGRREARCEIDVASRRDDDHRPEDVSQFVPECVLRVPAVRTGGRVRTASLIPT